MGSFVRRWGISSSLISSEMQCSFCKLNPPSRLKSKMYSKWAAHKVPHLMKAKSILAGTLATRTRHGEYSFDTMRALKISRYFCIIHPRIQTIFQTRVSSETSLFESESLVPSGRVGSIGVLRGGKEYWSCKLYHMKKILQTSITKHLLGAFSKCGNAFFYVPTTNVFVTSIPYSFPILTQASKILRKNLTWYIRQVKYLRWSMSIK